MPTYTYTGDEDRYYPTLGLTPKPGEQHDLERNPGDGRWTPEDPPPAAPAEAETAAAAPAPTVAGKPAKTAAKEG